MTDEEGLLGVSWKHGVNVSTNFATVYNLHLRVVSSRRDSHGQRFLQLARRLNATHSPAAPIHDLAGEPEQFLRSSADLLALPAKLGAAW